MGAKEEAVALKDEGNKAIANREWGKAVELYTKAIELDGTQCVFYSNRAQAHIKMESFGFAIEDATKAIELNPGYVKAYYRRAISSMAIMKSKEALKDFRTVARQAPNDRDAALKLAECEKLVKRLNFEKAIAVEESPSPSAGLDIAGMVVEDGYNGARLEEGVDMTSGFIEDMIERFKTGKKLHKKYVYHIIVKAKDIFYAEPTMPEVTVEKGNTLTICGDTHGQYFDLLEIFRLNGLPSEKHSYLFNGDFVDRGSWSTEIALLLFSYKILYPKSFFVNRGNHETDDMNRVYGFEGECKAKYNERTFKLFSEAFSALPLAHLVGKQYLVLHGGLFSDDKVSLDDIRNLDRHKQKQPGQSGLMMEMLWTDPQQEQGRSPSKRGVGMMFGPDVTERFCNENNLKAIIRSHEVRMDGYEVEHNGRCITVFSAPNYVDTSKNQGAFINVDENYELQHKQFKEVPHPNIKPMAYASSPLASMM